MTDDTASAGRPTPDVSVVVPVCNEEDNVEPLRSRLTQRGLERASAFPWARTAELTDRELGKLLTHG